MSTPLTIQMSRQEHAEALAWALLIAVLTSLPYLLGYLSAPPDRYFLGFVLNAGDQNTYFMWMTQAAAGEVFLRNLYTSIAHEGAMLSLFFLFAGALGRALGSLDLAYQLLRVLAVILLAWSLWFFIATFTGERRQRRWLFLLCVLGAGLGWAWNLSRLFSGDYGGLVTDTELLERPFDLWVPEGYVFYSMLVMPHFTAAIALLLLTLRWAALGLRDDRLGLTALAGLMCAVLSFVHPYDVLIALGLSFAVVGLHTSRQRRLTWAVWRHPLLLAAIAVGPILYNYWILNHNPGMQAWLVQNKSASPPPLSYLAGYGFLLLGALAFLVQRARALGRDLEPWQWLAAWLLILPLAVYAPIDFQRRLAIGASVPMALAGGLWLWQWAQGRSWWHKPLPRAALLLGILALAAPSSAFHWLNSFRKVTDYRGELFADRETVEALTWLGGQPNPVNGTVLASFETGNLVPRFSGLTTVIGSRGQTGDFDRVLTETRAFFANRMTDGQMRNLLARHRVTWVVLGPQERQERQDGAVEDAAGVHDRLASLGLMPVYRTGDGHVVIYGPGPG
jgi:hypothetical protein